MSHPVLERLSAEDPTQRVSACRDAVDDPSAVLLLDALASALSDPDRRVAEAASDSLARLRETLPEVAQAVRAALRGTTPSQRWHAAFTYARIEPPSPRILPPLIEALACQQGEIRWAAARLLVNAGRAIGEVLPLMLGLARSSENPWVRTMAVYCLRELAPDEAGCAKVVVDATRDTDIRVRHAALTALAAFHGRSDSVLERLVEVIGDTADPTSRRIAVFSLGHLGQRRGSLTSDAIAALQSVADTDPSSELRAAAQRALARTQRH